MHSYTVCPSSVTSPGTFRPISFQFPQQPPLIKEYMFVQRFRSKNKICCQILFCWCNHTYTCKNIKEHTIIKIACRNKSYDLFSSLVFTTIHTTKTANDICFRIEMFCIFNACISARMGGCFRNATLYFFIYS